MASITIGNIIDSEQTITGSWVDLGSEVETTGYSFLKGSFNIDINDSLNVQLRIKGMEISGGDEFDQPLYIIKRDKTLVDYYIYEINNDEDQKIDIHFDSKQRYNIIKWQVRALTVGSTAGKILTATYRQGYNN